MSCSKDGLPEAAEHRDFGGRRLLLSLLRVLHIVGLAGLSAALLGGGTTLSPWGGVMAGSGLAIVALDRWSDRYYFHQVKGLVALLKIVLVILLALAEPLRLPLFWFLLVFSVSMAHAPGSVRHRRVL
jgi:hypothetical protein